jgi:Flp pilus assembly pilin Flp
MHKPGRVRFPPRQDARGQGLVEYAILLAFIAVIAIAGLELAGGSVKQGFINVCAELGNAECEAAKSQPATAVAQTAIAASTAVGSPTPPPTVTPTAVLVNPEPTRPPVVVAFEPTVTPTQVVEKVTMRIKVVINKKGGKKQDTKDGVRVVVYNEQGMFVAQGRTDDKGDVSFSVPAGTYTVATYYEDVWVRHGPFAVKNSSMNVLHITEPD